VTLKEISRPTATPVPAKTAPPPRRMSPFDLLQTEIERVFDSFNGWPAAFTERAFSPSMEVVETDNAIEVSTELPGIDEKDVEISVSDNVLTIRGEKKFEKDEKKKNYRLVERSYGSFERSIALPQGVDASKVKAKMTKGVLKVEVPKPAASKAQQVRINVD
jgi:HSP20 family protein